MAILASSPVPLGSVIRGVGKEYVALRSCADADRIVHTWLSLTKNIFEGKEDGGGVIVSEFDEDLELMRGGPVTGGGVEMVRLGGFEVGSARISANCGVAY